jgi:hypothetical protein
MTEETKDMNLIVTKPIADQMLMTLERTDVISQEDYKFLVENKESLQKTLVKTHMWRTKGQHDSILSDSFFPSLHGKFHQAILEQKVQFSESIRLAKEYELQVLTLEEKEIELEELQFRISNPTDLVSSYVRRKEDVMVRKLQVEISSLKYSLTDMKIAMDYRMKEVKSWENIKNDLITEMVKKGLNEEQIYDKEYGELENYFFTFLNNLKGVKHSTDGGEVNNLIGLAIWVVQRSKELNAYNTLVGYCNAEQLAALNFLETLQKTK